MDVKNKISILKQFCIILLLISNLCYANSENDTITHWKLYKDSQLLLNSNYLSSTIHNVTIKKSENFKTLSFSIFYDYTSEISNRKIEFLNRNQVIATFSHKTSVSDKFVITKDELDKVLNNYNEPFLMIYSDSIHPNGIVIGIIEFVY